VLQALIYVYTLFSHYIRLFEMFFPIYRLSLTRKCLFYTFLGGAHRKVGLGISIGTAIVLIGVHIILGNRFNARINEMKANVKTGDTVVKQSYEEAAALKDE
jgi:hypothetical protein